MTEHRGRIKARIKQKDNIMGNGVTDVWIDLKIPEAKLIEGFCYVDKY